MLGAIIGDIVGSRFEFGPAPQKGFKLFTEECDYTDDTICTIAVADALMNTLGQDDNAVKAELVRSMQRWGAKYPNAGYGGMFYRWLHKKDPEPYGSFGNGSAMRVSAAGWLCDTLEETRHMACLTAEVTHNHPEGIKGAEAAAAAIFMARTGRSKEEIKEDRRTAEDDMKPEDVRENYEGYLKGEAYAVQQAKGKHYARAMRTSEEGRR